MKQFLSVTVSGYVQGVGFRYFVSRLARKYRVEGWVKNTSAGDVEALLVGDDSVLVAMRADMARGPIGSHVRNVEWHVVEDNEAEYEAGVFKVLL